MHSPLTYAKQICYSTEETLMFTYEQAKKYMYSNLEGAYVECGVAAGAQIIAMIYGNPRAKVYAFDSFCGIPLPSNRDDQMPGITMLSESERKALPDPGKQKLETTGATSVSKKDFMNHIESAFGKTKYYKHVEPLKYPNLEIVEGWFEHTVKVTDTGPISLLRLDGDLYNSTFVCLEYLFPKVINGGVVIMDDFQLPGCRDACVEYFEGIRYYPKWKTISNIAYFEK
jgi:O-methyltransferase